MVYGTTPVTAGATPVAPSAAPVCTITIGVDDESGAGFVDTGCCIITGGETCMGGTTTGIGTGVGLGTGTEP